MFHCKGQVPQTSGVSGDQSTVGQTHTQKFDDGKLPGDIRGGVAELQSGLAWCPITTQGFYGGTGFQGVLDHILTHTQRPNWRILPLQRCGSD